MKELIFLPVLFLSSVVMANDFYVVGGFGVSTYKIWDYQNFISKDESDKAFKIILGYQINSDFSAEFGYADLGKGKFNHSDGSAGTLNVNAFLMNFRMNLLKINQITPYVKLGISSVKNSERWTDSTSFDRKTEMNLYWALGGEYAIDKKYFLSIDYDYYGKSGAFNRADWSTQPAGVKASSLTFGVKRLFQ